MLDSAATDLERFSPSEQFAAAAVLEMPGPDVLVVEDDADCGHALGVWLESLGHGVATLRDGTRVVRWIEHNEPKLVLLDLGLPGMHGLKILHELRMLGLTAPVVVVTAQGSPEVAARARAMGAVAVLGKPIDRRALRPLLDELLPEQFGAQVTWSPNAATTIPSSHMPPADDMSAMRGLARTWLRRRNATRGGARS